METLKHDYHSAEIKPFDLSGKELTAVKQGEKVVLKGSFQVADVKAYQPIPMTLKMVQIRANGKPLTWSTGDAGDSKADPSGKIPFAGTVTARVAPGPYQGQLWRADKLVCSCDLDVR